VPSGGVRGQRPYPPIRTNLAGGPAAQSRNPPHWVHPLLAPVFSLFSKPSYSNADFSLSKTLYSQPIQSKYQNFKTANQSKNKKSDENYKFQNRNSIPKFSQKTKKSFEMKNCF